MVKLLRLIDGKGRRTLVMEGTTRPMGIPLSIQRRISADYFDDIVFLFELVEKFRV